MHFPFSSASYANRLGTLIRKTPFPPERERKNDGGKSAVNFQVLLPQVLAKLRSLCRVLFVVLFVIYKLENFLKQIMPFFVRQTPLFSDSINEVLVLIEQMLFLLFVLLGKNLSQHAKQHSASASRGICRVQFKLNFNFNVNCRS